MTPLTNKKRKILFSVLFVLFIILGPLILLNSFGYKLNETFTFVKTGGLYIHSEVPNTSVYVNGTYIKDNSTFFKNVLIQKLRPNQEYKVEIYRDGFHGWVKNIYVYPGLVSEGYSMMLSERFVQKEIFPFFDKEGEGVNVPITGFTKVQKTSKGQIIPENQNYIDIITLFEGENPYEEKIPEVINSTTIAENKIEELPKSYIELGIKDLDLLDNLIETSNEISWLYNGDIVLYWVDNIETIPYYFCGGIKERICNEEIVLDWDDEIKRFNYFPGRDDVWIVLTNSGIYAVEVDPRGERNIQPIYLGASLDFRLDNAGNLIVKEKGSYIELDL